jgi:hypothetical protein
MQNTVLVFFVMIYEPDHEDDSVHDAKGKKE